MSSEKKYRTLCLVREEKEDIHMIYAYLEQQQAELKRSKRIQKIKMLTFSTQRKVGSAEVMPKTVPFYITLV